MTRLRWALIIAICLIVVAACATETADQSTTLAPAASTTTALPPATGTNRPAGSTITTSTASTTTQPSPTDLAAGLLCRDIAAMGYGYADAVAYWNREGKPDRMDAGRNGIPCETVYPAGEVTDYWGDPLPTSTTAPTPYGPTIPWRYPDPIPPGSPNYGSGCSPGTSGLPDGEWFGFLTQIDPGGVEFDLACLVVPGDDEEGGAPISNDNPRTRSLPVEMRTPVHYVAGGWVDGLAPYADWVDSIGCYDPSCPVWLYVNGGRVTAIAEHFLTG